VLQSELKKKDGQLEKEKAERETLEKEISSLLQRSDAGVPLIDPRNGGVLNSALQQLQKELAREAVANDELMKKAETLLQQSNPLDGEEVGVGSPATTELRGQLRSMAEQVQAREKENDRLKKRVRELQEEVRYDIQRWLG
jgi:cell division protein FtsB